MIWFQLGREYKLSIAEILAVFPDGKTVYFGRDFLILDNVSENKVLEKANNLWWTIKIIKILDLSILDIASNYTWKFNYWISVFWEKKNLKNILINQKKEFKSNWISSRFVNKDFKNLSSAQIIWEKLINSWSDFSYIFSSNSTYFWITIWVQDINSYSKRDYWKSRDMQIWMLPPKLCQIMINLWWWDVVYDPFVWLWTVLIESINMWNKCVYWSDLNDRMIEYSNENIKKYIKETNIKIDNFEIIKLNAKFVNESEILLTKDINSIVSEWYLWEIMTNVNISLDRIEKQKKSLLELYSKFFEWLKKINFAWNIVICFPFWEFKWKLIYFVEILEILDKYCTIQTFFPDDFTLTPTKTWSLLYKRDKQLVGREIYKLKIKMFF